MLDHTSVAIVWERNLLDPVSIYCCSVRLAVYLLSGSFGPFRSQRSLLVASHVASEKTSSVVEKCWVFQSLSAYSNSIHILFWLSESLLRWSMLPGPNLTCKPKKKIRKFRPQSWKGSRRFSRTCLHCIMHVLTCPVEISPSCTFCMFFRRLWKTDTMGDAGDTSIRYTNKSLWENSGESMRIPKTVDPWFPHHRTENYLSSDFFFLQGWCRKSRRFANCVLKFGKATSFSKRMFIVFRKGAAFMGSHLAESQLSVVTDRCPEKNTKRRSPSDQPLIGSTGIAHAHLHFCIDAHDGVYACELFWSAHGGCLQCFCCLGRRLLLQCRMSLNLEDIGM